MRFVVTAVLTAFSLLTTVEATTTAQTDAIAGLKKCIEARAACFENNCTDPMNPYTAPCHVACIAEHSECMKTYVDECSTVREFIPTEVVVCMDYYIDLPNVQRYLPPLYSAIQLTAELFLVFLFCFFFGYGCWFFFFLLRIWLRDYANGEQCCLCLEPFGFKSRVYCQRCSKSMHVSCWSEANRFGHSRCPMCRAQSVINLTDNFDFCNELYHNFVNILTTTVTVFVLVFVYRFLRFRDTDAEMAWCAMHVW